MRPLDVLTVVFVMLIWGVNFTVAKTGMAEISPILMIFLRFTLVAALLVPFVPRPAPPQMRRIAVIGLCFGGLHFPLMFVGISGVDASYAAIASQLSVPFSALLAAAFYGDRLGWRRTLGLLIAFAGIAVIAGRPTGSSSLFYLGLLIAGAAFWSVANMQIKELGPIDGFQLSAWIAVFSVPLLLAASLVFEDGQIEQLASAGWIGWGAVVYQGVAVAILSYSLWYPLVRRYDVNVVMPFNLLNPVFGVLCAVLILGDPLTWSLLVGAALVIGGVGIITVRRPRLVDARASNNT
jgi:O-acetylserine/cysteine efflux transporter